MARNKGRGVDGPVAAGLAGIDVAKGWLDVAFGGQLERVDNTREGVRRLITMLRRGGVRQIGLEPTGGYERIAVALLRKAGFDVRMVDSWRLRQFAKARGLQAKSDPIDARMIAVFMARESTRPFPEPSAAEAARRAWVREITRAEADRRRLLNGQQSCTLEVIAKRLRAEIEALTRAIAEATQAIADLIAQQPAFARKAELMASMDGIGAKTVRVFLAELPEIGTLDDREAASLCGLAPHPKDTGKRKAEVHRRRPRCETRRLSRRHRSPSAQPDHQCRLSATAPARKAS